MTRYCIEVFEVLVTDEPSWARWRGPVWACRIERYGHGRREELALAYGPSKLDALERARDYQRYVRDMERRIA